jgi:hypothetical protein
VIAHSTREDSMGASSRRDTLFVGETSNSLISVEVDGAYICREDECEDGRIRVAVEGWTASGAEENVGKSR